MKPNKLDQELIAAMEMVFKLIKASPENKDSDEQLKMRIVASNLKALADIFLMADSKPEEVEVDYKRVALGLLGTSDYLIKDLPEIDEPELKVPDL